MTLAERKELTSVEEAHKRAKEVIKANTATVAKIEAEAINEKIKNQ